MITNHKISIFLISLFIWQFSFAQNSNISQQKEINKLLEISDSLLTSYPDQSLTFAKQALQLSEEQEYENGQLQAMIQLADIYWKKTDLKTALNLADKAKNLAIKLDNKKEYAEAILIISKAYTDFGDYDKSSDLNFQVLVIYEKLKDKRGIGKALNEIGNNYFEQQNYDEALEYFQRSLALATEINDLDGIARGLNNVAAVYGNKGDSQNFKSYLKEAIEINKKIGNRLWEGINYLNLGSLYKNEKSYDTSFYYYNAAAVIFKELNNLTKLAAVYNNFSMYYSDLNQQDSSLYYAKLAYDIGQKNNLKKTVYNAAILLHELYKNKNDLNNAYQYSTIHYQMRDSLDIENKMTRLSQLELLYEFDKIEQENRLKQQKREYTYIFIGTSLLFFLIIVVIIVINRNRLKRKNQEIEKRQLKSELEIRNKELASNVMILMRKNEILSEIADKLMDIRDEAVKDETKSAIKRIARELQKTTDDEIWQEFETRFKQVHGEFYEKLINRFPDLSPNEQKICAFLRLNMSTKEISELTGQRINTLEIARSRLRKKLGIANTNANLVTFLSQI